MQLRYLQTLTEIGAEQNSTVVFPMPIDIIKPFLELLEKVRKPAPLDASMLPARGRDMVADPGHHTENLRSIDAVVGYHIAATDGEIGHIEDFLVDDGDWRLRYMTVDTKNWFPGQRVLLSPHGRSRRSTGAIG